jgi:hypothetical protein
MFRSTEPDLVQKNQVHVKFCILDLFYPFEFNGKEYSWTLNLKGRMFFLSRTMDNLKGRKII